MLELSGGGDATCGSEHEKEIVYQATTFSAASNHIWPLDTFLLFLFILSSGLMRSLLNRLEWLLTTYMLDEQTLEKCSMK